MRLKTIWDKTGDTLLFDVSNENLAEWFVNISNEKGNRYKMGGQIIDDFTCPANVQDLIEQEIAYIDTVNEILQKLKMPAFNKPSDWYNQQQLNKLHKDWAQSRKQWPKLSELLNKLDKKYYDAYEEMNCHIHLIENSFKYAFRDVNHWRVENPFKDNFFPWELSNLYISYPGHGRFSFEKFVNSDIYDDIWLDDSNWENIDSFVGMNLRRPYKKAIPLEFLSWCNEKNLIPTEASIPLGNLVDWENSIASARKTVETNIKISDNFFTISIA